MGINFCPRPTVWSISVSFEMCTGLHGPEVVKLIPWTVNGGCHHSLVFEVKLLDSGQRAKAGRRIGVREQPFQEGLFLLPEHRPTECTLL